MLGRGLTALVLAVALVAPVLAESPLVVMDSNNQVYGEVISADMDLKYVTMLYRLDTGGFAVFKVDNWSVIANFVFAFYAIPGCSGQPLFEIPPDNTARVVTYLHRITWEPNSPGGAHSIMRYPGDAAGTSMTPASYYHPTLGCVTASTAVRKLVPAEFVEYLRTPPPPFHVELNPVIFQDQFQTGDMSRWSNY